MAAYKNKEELMNTDWQTKINDAKASGDMQAAAIYEQARNDKINSKDYTGTQKTTNNYSQYLNSGSSGSGSSNDGLHFRGIDYTQTGGGIYGVPTIDSDVKNYTQGGVTYQVGANMARRPDLAGKIAISNGYTVFYDDNGYATKAIKGVADYTPHQDINAGNGTYNSAGAWTDNEMLTQNDKDAIDGYRKLASEGKMSWSDANAKANAIRSGYGYTIDNKGNVTDLLAKSNVDARRQQWGIDTPLTDAQQTYLQLMFPEQQTTDGNALLDALSALKNGASMQLPDLQEAYYSSGSPAPQWNGSEWDNVLNALAEQLLNMNYEDWTKGDQYQALAERYGQQGKMSMQDVLGQVSSRTGGLASSWAQTAANQQYNSFMSQLEDAAMEMYGVERDDLYNRANMARQYAEDDYNKYLDAWNQWNTNRNFNYGAYRDSVADSQWQQQFNYNANRDSIADQQWQQSFDYNKYRDDVADSQWQKTFDYNASKQKNGSSGDRNGNGNGIGSDVYSWLARSGAKDYGTAYQMLRNNGYSTTDANRYAKYFADTYMADTKPVVDESSGGYDVVLSDVQALRKAGESSATINNVIVQAQKKGLITSAQADQLRGSYVGSR